MPLDDIVSVVISTASAAPSRAGFGVPMILSASTSATWTTPERVRSYSSLTAVGVDFASTTPEYKAAARMFSQRPRPPKKILIGKLSSKPVMIHDVGLVAAPVVGQRYAFMEKGVEIAFTATTTTLADTLTGLVAAVTAAAISGVSAAVVGSAARITGTADTWLDTHLEDASGLITGPAGPGIALNLLTFASVGAEPATPMATQLDALLTESKEWYAPLNPYYSKAIAVAIAAWMETQKRLYFQASADTEIITVASVSATDVAETLKDSSYFRSWILFHPRPDAFLDAGIYGRYLPTEPGQSVPFHKTIAGVPKTELSGTHITNLKAKNAGWYEDVAGLGNVEYGKSASGEWVDKLRDLDWLQANIQADVLGALFSAEKIAQTDEDSPIIEAPLRARLERATRSPNRVLAADPKPEVNAPLVADMSPEDLAERHSTGWTFTGKLAGAVHDIDIQGQVTL
jgi:hypothetical protein